MINKISFWAFCIVVIGVSALISIDATLFLAAAFISLFAMVNAGMFDEYIEEAKADD